ncbi:MAG: hypothetical protein D3909_09170, partial [Candidatus Electrothrix sp. ATG1]|nr:hypothetical protein [Candidatus Electrothrix sp. ATG1]
VWFVERKLPQRWYHYFCFQSEKIKGKRRKAACLLEHMQDLRMRPMLLQHIDELLDAGCGEWNAYTVYGVLIGKWLDREVRKLQKQHKRRRVPTRQKLFYTCLLVAETMERQGERIISEKALSS